MFLTKVVAYLGSVDTAITFFIINKKCGMISSMLRINPHYDDNSLEKEIVMFPNIETLRCDAQFFSDRKELLSTIKYLHIIDTNDKQAKAEKDIPKTLLSNVTSFTTLLTKLSILKSMKNLEFLKVICVNNSKKNAEIFKEIDKNDMLKTIIIDARGCENKYITEPLLKYNTKGRNIILICSDLNEIIKKENVTIACTYGSTEVTKSCTEDYIPFKTNEIKERNREFSFKFHKMADRFEKPYASDYLRCCFDSLVNMNVFQTILNKSLPTDICIDITKKNKPKGKTTLNDKLPTTINITNDQNFIRKIALHGSVRGKKLIDITIPKSTKTLFVNTNSFNINGCDGLEKVYYRDVNNIQLFSTLTHLKIVNLKDNKVLDCSGLNHLKRCDIACDLTQIKFPKHKLDKAELFCQGVEHIVDLKVDELVIQIDSSFKSFTNAEIKSINFKLGLKRGYCLGIDKEPHLVKLGDITQLQNLSVEYGVSFETLPISLQTINYSGNRLNKEISKSTYSLSKLTNIESLKIPMNFIKDILSLSKLSSLTLSNYIDSRSKEMDESQLIDLSGLTNIKNMEIYTYWNPITLPTSLTSFFVGFGYWKKGLKEIDIDYLNHLEVLQLRNTTKIVSLPTTLTNFQLYVSKPFELDLTKHTFKKFVFSRHKMDKDDSVMKFIKLPSTLEHFSYAADPDEGIMFDINHLKNLKVFDLNFEDRYNQPTIDLGELNLPSTLEKFCCTKDKATKLKFKNTENTQLPKLIKEKLMKNRKI